MDSGLKRRLTLPLITFYGIGTILGAGIYVLIGEVAAIAGSFTPISFVIASFVAAFSAFSFAELSSRFPKSAGEALYVQAAFAKRALSILVGLTVVSIATISAAAIIRGFTGYLNIFINVSDSVAIVCLTVFLCVIAMWGILESVMTISFITIIEIGGLMLIIWVGSDSFIILPERLPELMSPMNMGSWIGVFSGAILAFYAFIGFEDMVNVAEEVKNPRKNLPLAIIIALLVTTLLYICVSLVAVLSVPLEKLAGSDAPLAVLYEYKTGSSPILISLISIVAVTNGALVQIILGSRVLYGLSNQGWLPTFLGKVNKKTGTPVRATLLLSLIIVTMSLWLPLVTLAHMTSMITLSLFFVINISLLTIKRQNAAPPPGARIFPAWVPMIGALTTGTMLILEFGHRLWGLV